MRKFRIMGILNITPDSFSDGGKFFGSIDKVVDRAAQIVEEGGEIIDIGGESTRPGSLPVSIDEELNRVIPATEEIRKRFDTIISIDTRKSEVAEKSLLAGANWINDVSGGRYDENLSKTVAKYDAVAVVMHSRGTPRTMQDNPFYEDVIAEVKSELRENVEIFLRAGVSRDKIIIDPGIGFGKRLEDNIKLTAKLNKIAFDDYKILYAPSRKRFIAQLLESTSRNRLFAGLAAVGQAYTCGAEIFRVHDVGETADFLKMLRELIGNSSDNSR